MKVTIMLLWTITAAVTGFGNGNAIVSASRFANVDGMSQKRDVTALACDSETPCGPGTSRVLSNADRQFEREVFGPVCPPSFPCVPGTSPTLRRFAAIAMNVSEVDYQG
jgi:hypothetical protein